ncbi:hypothetical protein CTEN210_00077 [Chaetoceros tenuissimus]|uniref:C2H2-type domain-containing protein n=1 Tax=Chaetoceros tenuissimus TaxID=426638 RepID=A0AAD3CEW0_9STRA|nr:hypothetical protein CTEN210_00077 [Chaetoceros tenuissimus]
MSEKEESLKRMQTHQEKKQDGRNWKTDLICLETKSSHVDNINVPISGEYSFIFGKKVHGDDFEQVDPTQSKNGNENVYCGCSFQAVFTKDDKEESLNLPLAGKKGKLITSSRVGKRIILSKNTQVKVISVSKCQKTDEFVCSFVWGLRLVKCNKQVSDKRPKTDEEEHSFVDFSTTSKKNIICSECGRGFPDCVGCKNHYVSTHAPKVGEEYSYGTNRDDDYEDLVGPKIFRKPLLSVFQDDDLAIVVKPQGMAVQGPRFTLPKSDLLLQFKSTTDRNDNLSKPRIAHRLDADTGGLLVVAKTSLAEKRIKKSFEHKKCRKRYQAIVFGKLELNNHAYTDMDEKDIDISSRDEEKEWGIINAPLSGKESVTRYKIVTHTQCNHPMANGFITTVDLYPLHGRQHQLRRHLQMIGHPIWGDLRYADYQKEMKQKIKECRSSMKEFQENDEKDEVKLHSKMCLWALSIQFPHPCNDELVKASIEEPNWYQYLRKTFNES